MCYAWVMAHVTLYLPDGLLEQLRDEASAAHRSLSDHIRERLSPPTVGREELDRLFGTCDLGSPPEDPPPDEIEPL